MYIFFLIIFFIKEELSKNGMITTRIDYFDSNHFNGKKQGGVQPAKMEKFKDSRMSYHKETHQYFIALSCIIQKMKYSRLF